MFCGTILKIIFLCCLLGASLLDTLALSIKSALKADKTLFFDSISLLPKVACYNWLASRLLSSNECYKLALCFLRSIAQYLEILFL